MLPFWSTDGDTAIPLRQHKWQHVLQERPCLTESIQSATGWRADWIPNRYAVVNEHTESPSCARMHTNDSQIAGRPNICCASSWYSSMAWTAHRPVKIKLW